MNVILKQPITGMVDKSSNTTLKLSDMFIGNDKILSVQLDLNIIPLRDIEHQFLRESFTLRVKKDDEVIIDERIEVDLAQGCSKSFDKDIELHNLQTEVHKFEVIITNISKDLIKYTSTSDMVTIPPIKSSKVFIRLDYYKRGTLHNFSYYTNSTNKVYLKTNNHSWKEISDGFTIDNKDLEGKVNYFQLYTTDNENTKSYSNVQRIVKSD